MLKSSKVIQYDPHSSRKAPRIQPKQWEDLRERLETLWLREDKSLDDVMKIMAQDYGFTPSRRQYISKFASWKWHKAVPAKVMKNALRRASKHPQRRRDFKFQGREITQDNMNRFQLRHPSFDPASSPTCSFPSELDCVSIASTASDLLPEQEDLALGTPCEICALTEEHSQPHEHDRLRELLCMDATGQAAETLTLEDLDEIEERSGPSSSMMNAKKAPEYKSLLRAGTHLAHIVLEGRKRLLPQFHWDTARAYENLALAYNKLEKYDKSKGILLTAAYKWAEATNFEAQAVFLILKSLIHNSLLAGDLQAAIEFCEDVTTKLQKHLGLQHFRAWIIYREIGQMFADYGHLAIQERLMGDLIRGIEYPLFESSTGLISRYLRFCWEYLTSERCKLDLADHEPRLLKAFLPYVDEWNTWDTIYFMLSRGTNEKPRFDPSELCAEIFEVTGMEDTDVAITHMNLFADIWPASADHIKSTFEQIGAAVSVLASMQNITELWIKACPEDLLWKPEHEPVWQRRHRSNVGGEEARSSTEKEVPVNKHQSSQPLLPGMIPTRPELESFFDFSAFSSPSPTAPTSFSTDNMRSSIRVFGAPRTSNHQSSFDSILHNPSNIAVNSPLYEGMDET